MLPPVPSHQRGRQLSNGDDDNDDHYDDDDDGCGVCVDDDED